MRVDLNRPQGAPANEERQILALAHCFLLKRVLMREHQYLVCFKCAAWTVFPGMPGLPVHGHLIYEPWPGMRQTAQVRCQGGCADLHAAGVCSCARPREDWLLCARQVCGFRSAARRPSPLWIPGPTHKLVVRRWCRL